MKGEINACKVLIASRKRTRPFSSTHTFPTQAHLMLYKASILSEIEKGDFFFFFLIHNKERENKQTKNYFVILYTSSVASKQLLKKD